MFDVPKHLMNQSYSQYVSDNLQAIFLILPHNTTLVDET